MHVLPGVHQNLIGSMSEIRIYEAQGQDGANNVTYETWTVDLGSAGSKVLVLCIPACNTNSNYGFSSLTVTVGGESASEAVRGRKGNGNNGGHIGTHMHIWEGTLTGNQTVAVTYNATFGSVRNAYLHSIVLENVRSATPTDSDSEADDGYPTVTVPSSGIGIFTAVRLDGSLVTSVTGMDLFGASLSSQQNTAAAYDLTPGSQVPDWSMATGCAVALR